MTWKRRTLTQEERWELMVQQDIVARGITDESVVTAMRSVPRHRFVDSSLSERAYDDRALPIESGQTISQPYIVALMVAAVDLTPTDRVLEVGTGSGYGAAVLGQLASRVWTVERIESLADRARQLLEALGIDNVQVVHSDGTVGLPDQAPFDAIVVTASGPAIPDALRSQLADGGRLVMPVGRTSGHQTLVRVHRHGDEYTQTELGGVVFVPLIGEQGWPAD